MKAWSLFLLAALIGGISTCHAQAIPGTNQDHVHSGKLPVRHSDTIRYAHEMQIPDATDIQETADLSLQVTAYPNPSVDNITFSSAESQMTSISVVDTRGSSIVAIEPDSQSVTLDVSAYKSGTYFARIEIDGHLHTVQFVVTR